MGSRWGVDTLSVIDPSLASGATYGLHSQYPSNRYQDGEAGALVGYTSNIRWIVPLYAPWYYLSGGSFTDGQNVGYDFCNYLRDRLNTGASPKVHLPTLRYDSYGNPILRVYLNVEPDQPLTQDFWNGWASAVSGYNYGGLPILSLRLHRP